MVDLAPLLGVVVSAPHLGMVVSAPLDHHRMITITILTSNYRPVVERSRDHPGP